MFTLTIYFFVLNVNVEFVLIYRPRPVEVDLKSLFGLHVTWCAQQYSLAETLQLPTKKFQKSGSNYSCKPD